MKHGLFYGYNAGCCVGYKVWGISCNAPGNWWSTAENDQHHYWANRIQNQIGLRDPYDGGYPRNEDVPYTFSPDPVTVSVDKTLIPHEFTKVSAGTQWDMYAAKIPAVWPLGDCSEHPISSKEEGTWGFNLGWAMRHVREVQLDDSIINYFNQPRYCYQTRAIYVNGEQTYIVYNTSDWITNLNSPSRDYIARPYDWLGNHYILPVVSSGIDNDGRAVNYRATTFGGYTPDGVYTPFSRTDFIYDYYNTHEENILACAEAMFRINAGLDGLGNRLQPWIGYHPTEGVPVNCRCFGKQFFVISSYAPGRTVLGTNGWQVGFLEYTGIRTQPNPLTPATITGAIQAFASPFTTAGITDDVFGDIGISSSGKYAIALPSVRTYIDTATITGDKTHDEKWVIALKTTGTGPAVICTQWLEKVYRPNLGGMDDETGAADGTLHQHDIDRAITILDSGGQAGTDYPDETWSDIRVWCYNRAWNPASGRCINLALLTTSTTGDVQTTGGIIADFETGVGGFSAQYLDHNIDAVGLAFVNNGSINGNQWIADNAQVYTGSYAAKADINALFEGTTQLQLTINALTSGTVSFYYWFDNRKSGSRFGPPYAFNELTNFPEADHVFKITVNNNLVPITINDTDSYSSSTIDNVSIPAGNDFTEGFYQQWRKVTLGVDAGTSTIRWLINRKWVDDYGHLLAYLDNITLPQMMIGDDINSKKRWFFDGEKLYRNPFWAWAQRNEEGLSVFGIPDDILQRTSTVPDYITMRPNGTILMGNPHYVACIRKNASGTGWELDPDTGFEGGDGAAEDYGFIRFTASPNYGTLAEDCEDPDSKYTAADIVSDPPIGVFQILPVSDGGFQIRGANASINDASEYPINKAAYSYTHPLTNQIKQEKFKDFLRIQSFGAGSWNCRCHCWSISKDGRSRIPHVEVVWRPTLHQPAWPEAPDYANPPYRADFETVLPNDPEISASLTTPGIIRLRNPLYIPETGGRRAASVPWTLWNYVVPRIYSDAYSRLPQSVWISTSLDPTAPWDYTPGGTLLDPGSPPWGSAQWFLIQMRFNPASRWHHIYYDYPIIFSPDDLCLDATGGLVNGYTAQVILSKVAGFTDGAAQISSFPDFDVVYDIGENCCP